MRPRLCAIGHKVNLFLNASPFHSCETWLLLEGRTLCILRYTRGDHGEPKDQGQACAEAKEGEGRSASSYSNRASGRTPGHPAPRDSPDIRPQPGHLAPHHRTSRRWTSPARTSGQRPGHPALREPPDIRPAARTSGTCLCAENGPRAHVSPSHLPLRGLALYILPHLILVRFSKGLAHLR